MTKFINRLLILSLALSSQAFAQLETATAEMTTQAKLFVADGQVEAIKQTTVSAQTSGMVEEILFDVDDYVEQGQVLIRLKDTEQKAGLKQAEAELKAAIAKLQEAKDEYQRTKDLHQKQLVSQSQMDKTTSALKSAKAAQDAASATLTQASEQFEYTRIRAPYSGIVTKRLIELGEIASPGQRLMSGISLDHLRVNVNLPQSLIPKIRAHGSASVQLPDDNSVESTDITIFPFAHEDSSTFTVRVELPQRIENLFPGMLVKVSFVTGHVDQLTVPAESVVYRSEVTGIYVVDAQGNIGFRHVRTGQTDANGLVRVIAGLDAGESVALDPIAAGVHLKKQLAARYE